ncbi:MAG: T9SS type A sorting domain-containing protein, partial [Bacteroidales bacterium]|nr:T9SS type A sorting domain-containing protein [Bacteroidales bacterium]
YAVTDNITICQSELPYYYAPADTTFEVGTPALSIIHYPLFTVDGCDSTVTLNLTVETCAPQLQTQIIPVRLGWSEISAYLAVNDTISFGDVFDRSGLPWIISDTTNGIVLMQNAYRNPQVSALIGVTPRTTPWVNRIGYAVFSSARYLELIVEGLPYENQEISITPDKWNIIPVIRNSSTNIVDILNSIEDLEFDDIVCFSSLTNMYIYTQGIIIISTLNSLEPGVGYDVYSTKAFTIDYAALGNKSVAAPNGTYIPSTPWTSAGANPNYQIIFAEGKTLQSLSDNIEAGDVVSAFNSNGLCVGQGYYSGEEGLSIKVYGDDVMTEAVDGMLAGENISFKLYRPTTEETMNVVFEWSSEKSMFGDATYQNKSFSKISGIKSITGIGSHDELNVSVYPNPTSGEVNITANANIKSVFVHNTIGALVETRCTSSLRQTTTIDLGRYASGVYMLTITTEDGSKVIKKVV